MKDNLKVNHFHIKSKGVQSLYFFQITFEKYTTNIYFENREVIAYFEKYTTNNYFENRKV